MSLLFATPYLAAWIVAIVLSVIMLKRGGGRAERFLLVGSCLMLAQKLINVPVSTVIQLQIIPSLMEQGWSIVKAAMIHSYTGLFFGLMSLAGIVCLVYAFWIKFRVKSNANPQS
jgi:hypothetical protein